MDQAATLEKPVLGRATSWKLAAPDWGALDTLWRYPLPFVLWPVGNQPLLAHWMDEAVRRGVESIELYVPDRPAEVRAFLEDGNYWSRLLKIIPVARDAAAPDEAACINGLPGSPLDSGAPKTPGQLLERWFALQKMWLAQRPFDSHSLDTLHPSGGWISARARIHPSAKLTAPFWIGPRAEIGAKCEIGPNAFVGERAILDRGSQVEEACVMARTYLGQNTRVFRSIAENSVLVDFGRGCRVEIEEKFILAPVAEESPGPNLFERFLALTAYLLLAPLAKFCARGEWLSATVVTPENKLLTLSTGRRGPLWARRWPWLREIARGHLHWIGILPRAEEDWGRMAPETARRLRAAPVGIFSIADLHGSHEPSEPDEWIHAAYQTFGGDPHVHEQVTRNLWRIAWSKPAP